jgi:nucleotide-binding universal stress UspA family protein
MTSKYTLLVPIDFTEVTENALKFALELSNLHNSGIFLLHVIQNASMRIEAEKKMDLLIQKYQEKTKHELEKKIVQGKVLTDIGLIADSIGVDLVIMGTHSPSIWSKIFGSPAMSVVSNCDVPLILTHKETELSKINSIVLTVDLVKESIQVVRYAVKMAKLFNAKVHVVAQRFSDEIFMRKANVNIRIANNYLKENKLDTEVELLSEANFEKELLHYCKTHQVDLLAATYYQETFHLFSSNLVQQLADNSFGIPIMTINGEETSLGTSFGFITV